MSKLLKPAILEYFKSKGKEFEPCEGERYILTGIQMEEKKIRMVVFCDDNDAMVQIRTIDLAKAPAKRRAQAYQEVNEVNKEYRWIKFFMDDDGELVGQTDAIVDIPTGGWEVCELIERMAEVCSDCYPRFMRAFAIEEN